MSRYNEVSTLMLIIVVTVLRTLPSCHAWTSAPTSTSAGTISTSFPISKTFVTQRPLQRTFIGPLLYRNHNTEQIMDAGLWKSPPVSPLFIEPALPVVTTNPNDTNGDTSSESSLLPNNKSLMLQQHLAPYGMPWQRSIDSTSQQQQQEEEDSTLMFLKFWKWQVQFMQENLTNLQVLPLPPHLTLQQSTAKKHRMHTIAFCSDEYKYIRLTIMDAGTKTQVFTSVWYPNPTVTLDNNNHDDTTISGFPILGCDLLQFQQKRHLCICDFQPVASNNNNNLDHLLQPIRQKYPSLQNKMSGRFYNPNDPYFSSQLLLGRCNVDDKGASPTLLQDAHQLVHDDFFSAWKSYVQTHVQAVQECQQRQQQGDNTRDPITTATVLAQHQAYDTYSAQNDPAHGLLAANFGKEFADEYVYKVLFPLCRQGQETQKDEQ